MSSFAYVRDVVNKHPIFLKNSVTLFSKSISSQGQPPIHNATFTLLAIKASDIILCFIFFEIHMYPKQQLWRGALHIHEKDSEGKLGQAKTTDPRKVE